MTRIIGHRGARNIWPENSLSGFRKVAALPIDGVEFDVHRTASGELLVIHDALLERTTHWTGAVADLAPGAAAQVRLRDTDEGIPDLRAVLSVFADTDFELHIELKDAPDGTPYPGLAGDVLAAIERHGVTDRSLLTSFSVDVLADIRALSASCPTLNSFHTPGAEADGIEAGLLARLAVADVVAIEKSLLGAHWDAITRLVPVDRLGAWIANDEADLHHWLNVGLRQITTDDPVLASQVRTRIKLDD